MPPGDFAPVIIMSVLVVSAAATVVLRGPIGKALARWIESWGAAERAHLDAQAGAGPAQLHEIEQRLANLESRESRLAELEERLDFAERLLTRDAAARQLPIGGE